MFLTAILLLFITFPQTQAPAQAPKPHHHATAIKPAKSAEPAALKGPKPEAQLHEDLTAALRETSFAGDTINLTVSGNDITLHGVVHSAEHKGLATRMARKVAEKDGWKDVHVLNQIAVELPQAGH